MGMPKILMLQQVLSTHCPSRLRQTNPPGQPPRHEPGPKTQSPILISRPNRPPTQTAPFAPQAEPGAQQVALVCAAAESGTVIDSITGSAAAPITPAAASLSTWRRWSRDSPMVGVPWRSSASPSCATAIATACSETSTPRTLSSAVMSFTDR